MSWLDEYVHAFEAIPHHVTNELKRIGIEDRKSAQLLAEINEEEKVLIQELETFVKTRASPRKPISSATALASSSSSSSTLSPSHEEKQTDATAVASALPKSDDDDSAVATQVGNEEDKYRSRILELQAKREKLTALLDAQHKRAERCYNLIDKQIEYLGYKLTS
jgi:hypothetical protein